MPPMFRLRYPIFYSLLFASLVCASFAAFGNGLKKEPRNLQIAESDNPREVLKKALSASRSVKSYRIRIEVPPPRKAVPVVEAPSDRKSVTIMMEYAFPHSARIFGEDEEKIRAGKNFYHKKDDGAWERYHEKFHDVSVANLPAAALEDLIKSMAYAEDIKFIGRETVDGVPTLAYQLVMWADNGTYPMKIWIGVADGLLRRYKIECLGSNLKNSPVVYTYYDYNADIKIEPPAEYVSLPESRSQSADPKSDEFVPEGLPTVLPPYYPMRCPGSGLIGGVGSGRGSRVDRGAPVPSTAINPNVPVTDVDSKPILLNPLGRIYTERVRKNSVVQVRVLVLVGPDGLVKRVKVGWRPLGLDDEATRIAYGLRFKPAMKDGQPVSFWEMVPMEFRYR